MVKTIRNQGRELNTLLCFINNLEKDFFPSITEELTPALGSLIDVRYKGGRPYFLVNFKETHISNRMKYEDSTITFYQYGS